MAQRPRILLLPGLLCDEFVFAGLKAALSAHADVAVVDFSQDESIAAMARRALAVFPGKVSLVGYSMGGRVALEAVRQAADRIERLCLMDTGFGPARDAELPGRMALIELAHREGMSALAARWLPPMLHPRHEADTALLAPLTRMVERATPEQHERQIRALIGRPDAGPVLPTIRCPTLVMVGRQDRWATLAQHEAMAAAIPGARLEVIEDSGHFAPVEQTAAVASALLRWIGVVEPDRIPDTPLFDRARQLRGYRLNKATMALRFPESREAFRRDEAGYCARHGLSAAETRAVMTRDWRELIRLGGNVFYVLKISAIHPAKMTEIGAHQAGMEHERFLYERLGKR